VTLECRSLSHGSQSSQIVLACPLVVVVVVVAYTLVGMVVC
jgi:hypothetical protein